MKLYIFLLAMVVGFCAKAQLINGSNTTTGTISIGTSNAAGSKLDIQHATGTDALRLLDQYGELRFSMGQESSYTGNYFNSHFIDLKFKTMHWGGTGGNIMFYTGNTLTERLRIDNNGNVGIGKLPAIDNRLHVLGRFVAENEGIYATGDKGSIVMAAHTGYHSKPSLHALTPGGATSDLLINPAGGNVGIGVSPAIDNKLQVAGRLVAQNEGVYSTGDIGSVIIAANTCYYTRPSIHSLSPAGVAYDLLINPAGGNVGIGTSDPDQKLTVDGVVRCEELRVEVVGGVVPDYVFEPTYDLKPLSEVESYIKANKHLPEVPSAKELEEGGMNLKEMNLLLLKKVEELTLHLIEQQKIIQNQNTRLEKLEQGK